MSKGEMKLSSVFAPFEQATDGGGRMPFNGGSRKPPTPAKASTPKPGDGLQSPQDRLRYPNRNGRMTPSGSRDGSRASSVNNTLERDAQVPRVSRDGSRNGSVNNTLEREAQIQRLPRDGSRNGSVHNTLEKAAQIQRFLNAQADEARRSPTKQLQSDQTTARLIPTSTSTTLQGVEANGALEAAARVAELRGLMSEAAAREDYLAAAEFKREAEAQAAALDALQGTQEIPKDRAPAAGSTGLTETQTPTPSEAPQNSPGSTLGRAAPPSDETLEHERLHEDEPKNTPSLLDDPTPVAARLHADRRAMRPRSPIPGSGISFPGFSQQPDEGRKSEGNKGEGKMLDQLIGMDFWCFKDRRKSKSGHMRSMSSPPPQRA